MLIIFIIVFLVVVFILRPIYFGQSYNFGAPYVPTEPEVIEKMLQLTKIKKGEVFYDLGSGDGRLVIAAALHGAQAYGIEIDWLRVLYSRFWIWLLRLKNAQIIRKNFFQVDLSKADVVSLFLLQSTNQKLKYKLEKELKPGTKIVSYAFTFDNWQLVEKLFTKGNYGYIYLYKM